MNKFSKRHLNLAAVIFFTAASCCGQNLKMPFKNLLEIGYHHAFYFDQIPIYPFSSYDSVTSHKAFGVSFSYAHLVFQNKWQITGGADFLSRLVSLRILNF